MRKIFKTIALCIAWALLSISCTGSGRNGNLELPTGSIRNGDIIFRKGRSFSSEMVLAHDREGRYSHIGIVHKSDSAIYVIHAVNDEHDFKGDFDRVKIEPIGNFFMQERASAGAMYHSWVDDSISSLLTAKALDFVRDSVRFDHDFNHHDSKELYCTELIYMLYKEIGIDITEGRRTPVGVICFPDEIIFPDDIQKNKKLDKYFEF